MITKLLIFVSLSVGISIHSYCQMYFKITKAPATYKSILDTIHFPSSFNGWKPDYPSQMAGNNIFIIPPFTGTLEYKATRGTWNAVEGSVSGGEIPNRKVTYSQGDTIDIEIQTWKDIFSNSAHTASPEVLILKSDYPMIPFSKKRRIWVYLPARYANGSEKFPVLYMHDGQNLFDKALSFAGEWKVDEAMNEFAKSNLDCIVVGIDNGGGDRIDEYTPYSNPKYKGGQGEMYVDFLVNNLKPFIDSYFRTLPEPEHTGIMGSSLGGLISFYAGVKYPQVFGKIGVFSPSFWYSDSLKTDVINFTPNTNQKFYIMAGQNEDEDMVPDIDTYIDLMHTAGVPDDNIFRLIQPDGQHSEWFWAREFPAAYQWLDLWDQQSSTKSVTYVATYFKISRSPSPNPIIFIDKNMQGTAILSVNSIPSGKEVYSINVQSGDTLQMNGKIGSGAFCATLKGKGFVQTIKFIKSE